MNAEIKQPNVKLAIRNLEALPARLIDALGVQLAKSLDQVVGIATRDYLSGPRPQRLDVVTTRLRGSIASSVENKAGGITGRIGSNVKYAVLHEFGFKGIINVRAHTRIARVLKGGIAIDPRRKILDARGNVVGRKENTRQALLRLAKNAKKAKGIVVLQQQVKAHKREIDYAGKPFIRPALESHLPVITQDLKTALNNAQTNG